MWTLENQAVITYIRALNVSHLVVSIQRFENFGLSL